MDIENKINVITRIQRWWSARHKYLKNSDRMKFYTIIKRHIFVNIENPNSKYMSKMILIVTYSPHTNVLYFEMKNLENGRFYYISHPYMRYFKNSEMIQSKIDEIKNYCNNKLNHLSIRDNQLIFGHQLPIQTRCTYLKIILS